MQAAAALLPPFVVLLTVLGLRWSALAAALASCVATCVLWLAGVFAPATVGDLAAAIADAGVLTSLVAAMVIPGILFVEATRSWKASEAIAALVKAIATEPARAAILIACGIGVLVECLTGMGVSMLITVPLLFAMLEPWRAITIALVGMSLMPWGALALSAHVGAKLAALPIETLAAATFSLSGAVAALLPLLCVAIVPKRSASDWLIGVLASATLVGAIGLASYTLGIEIAGVAGSLAVIALMALLARGRPGIGKALIAPGLVPYVVLIAAVVAQKLAVAPLARLGIAPAIATKRVSFAILTSPGVALLAATLLTSLPSIGTATLASSVTRVWRPIASVALFMLSARLLVEIGAIAALASSLASLGTHAAVVAVALLGGLSGFITGSGISGNALFMPSAAAVGQNFGATALYAALQNTAAGHFAMASLPVGAILLAAIPQRQPGSDQLVVRSALMLATLHLMTVMTMAWIQLR